MAKWLDKLKAIFYKADNAPLDEPLVPTVGQLMLDGFQVSALLWEHGATITLSPNGKAEVRNPLTGKVQKLRAAPFAAILGLGTKHATIQVYGYRMIVSRSSLQFK